MQEEKKQRVSVREGLELVLEWPMTTREYYSRMISKELNIESRVVAVGDETSDVFEYGGCAVRLYDTSITVCDVCDKRYNYVVNIPYSCIEHCYITVNGVDMDLVENGYISYWFKNEE